MAYLKEVAVIVAALIIYDMFVKGLIAKKTATA